MTKDLDQELLLAQENLDRIKDVIKTEPFNTVYHKYKVSGPPGLTTVKICVLSSNPLLPLTANLFPVSYSCLLGITLVYKKPKLFREVRSG